ncbi:MAG: Ig-like domain-containing protein [Verrucomicrobia bacterium]|nr:Ig-like domain-containing protein [Verrucomicrobiota bacterium]
MSRVSVGFSQHNLAVAPTRSLRILNDGEPREIKEFAFDISPGSESESHQKVRFEVGFDNAKLFEVAPTIDAEGTLSFKTKKSAGQSEITVVAVDDGEEINSKNRSQPRTVTLFVVQDESDPSAISDDYEVWQDHVLHIRVAEGVLMNDLSINPSTMVATIVEEPRHGALEFQKHGGFCYNPDRGFLGLDRFVYRFNDSVGQSNVSTVTVHVLKPRPISPVKLELLGTYASGDKVTMNLRFRVGSEYVYYFDTSSDLNKQWDLGRIPNVGSWRAIFHQSNFRGDNPGDSQRYLRIRMEYNRGDCRSD